MHYCGIEVGPPGAHYLCALEEVRTDEPPVRLEARLYEPGSADAVAARIGALGDVVVGVAAPMTGGLRDRERRACDHALRHVGVVPRPYSDEGGRLFEDLSPLGIFAPESDDREGNVPDAAFETTPVFETNADGVFSALENQRLPARRHPLGVQRRIQDLVDNQVIDPGGGLWARRIEEIEAAAAAVCAHRFAVGHARWIGDPAEGVLVLPGTGPLSPFTTTGVLPPVTRVPL